MAASEASEAEPSEARPGAKGNAERHELNRRQAAGARRAAEAKATIPHGYAGRRLEVGEETSTAALLAAASQALAEQPALNAAYRDGTVERYSRVNVGFMIETEQGALVPTLFDADRMAMTEIETQLQQWEVAAHNDTLTAPELSGGTFTVSAVDSGADSLTGIVTPGQVGHLAVGRPHRTVVGGGGGELRSACVRELTLSCDQRAVRPPQAAAFLGAVARIFEDR